MNKKKTNGYTRLLVIFLVAVILVFAIGIVANGWQQNNEVQHGNNDSPVDIEDGSNDEKTDETEKEENPEPLKPEFFNYLTGLETTELLYPKRHLAFIFDSSSPLYGISNADLVIEVPLEDGNTRLISFINDYKELGKIGSITGTTDYISQVCDFFNGTIVSVENNSQQTSTNKSEHLNLSNYKTKYYTEYNLFNYTNKNLLTEALSSANIGENPSYKNTLPFDFTEYGKELISFSDRTASITINFTEKLSTELYYSEADNKYTFFKNSSPKNDLLNNNICCFDNCILLFSDTVTRENEYGKEFKLFTEGPGKGFYFTSGTYTEITFTTSSDGSLCFYNSNGTKLTVNRGKTYIGYTKSSGLENFKNNLQ